MNLEYSISAPDAGREGIDIQAQGVGVPLDQALAFALALLRTVQNYGQITVEPKADLS
jgi:hypothetical protein